MRAIQIYAASFLFLLSFAPSFTMEPRKRERSKSLPNALNAHKTTQQKTLPGIRLHGHEGIVKVLCFSPTGKKMASGSTGRENNLMVWDTKTAQLLYNFTGYIKGEITVLQFTSDGKTLLVGSTGNSNHLISWCVKTGQPLFDLEYHQDGIADIQCNQFGLIASASRGYSENLALWNEKKSSLHPLVGHKGPIQCIRFTPSGRSLVSSNNFQSEHTPQTIVLWNALNQQIIQRICCPNASISLDFSNDCTLYVGACCMEYKDEEKVTYKNSLCALWNMQHNSENPRHTFTEHNNNITIAMFSPSNKKMVSASEDEAINNCILWDSQTGKKIASLVGHRKCINSLHFSNDEKYFVSGGDKGIGNLLIWKTKDGELLYNLVGHKYTVYNALFSPGVNYIASAGGDHHEDSGELILWKFNDAS